MVDFTLTDEQIALREMAHDFAEKEIRPVAWEYDQDGTWPQAILEKAWELGLMNAHIPEAVRRAGRLLPRGCTDRGGALLGLLGHRHLDRGQRPRHRAARARRLRGAQGQVPRHAHRGAAVRLLLPDRARRRLRRLRHAHDRRPQGRQVGHQRLEVLHHQRRLRLLLHGLRQDRQGEGPPRHLLLHRAQGRHGHGGQEGRQDGPAGLQHRDHHLQRHRDPARSPDRRGGQGLQDRDDDPRPHAPRRGGDGHRHRARGVRVRDRLLQGARPVRRADRDAPGRSSS